MGGCSWFTPSIIRPHEVGRIATACPHEVGRIATARDPGAHSNLPLAKRYIVELPLAETGGESMLFLLLTHSNFPITLSLLLAERTEHGSYNLLTLSPTLSLNDTEHSYYRDSQRGDTRWATRWGWLHVGGYNMHAWCYEVRRLRYDAWFVTLCRFDGWGGLHYEGRLGTSCRWSMFYGGILCYTWCLPMELSNSGYITIWDNEVS